MCERDLQERFATGAAASLLVDYANRIQQMILGKRHWDWMLSDPFQFITEVGQTEYWIGPTGAAPAGTVDTGLNFSNVRQLDRGNVWISDQWAPLWNSSEKPQSADWQNPDGSYKQGSPAEYRNDRQSPNIISIFPAPNDGNAYEMVPPPPQSTTAAGGALAARTYYLQATFTDEAGNEGAPSSPSARQWVAASKLITVRAPQPAVVIGTAGIGYTLYNVYVGTVDGSLTLQQANIPVADDWTEAVSGLTTTGAAPPTDSDLEPLHGHVIGFRYYKQHTPLTATTDTFLIPDDFIDVVVAGMNWLGARYIRRPGAQAEWRQTFDEGMTRMRQDQNPWPGGMRFVKPDMGARTGRWPNWSR